MTQLVLALELWSVALASERNLAALVIATRPADLRLVLHPRSDAEVAPDASLAG